MFYRNTNNMFGVKLLGMYPVPFHWYMEGMGNIPLVYGRNGKYSIIVPLDYWNSSTGILESVSSGTLESGTTGTLESGSSGTLESGTTGTLEYGTTGTLESGSSGVLEYGSAGERNGTILNETVRYSTIQYYSILQMIIYPSILY